MVALGCGGQVEVGPAAFGEIAAILDPGHAGSSGSAPGGINAQHFGDVIAGRAVVGIALPPHKLTSQPLRLCAVPGVTAIAGRSRRRTVCPARAASQYPQTGNQAVQAFQPLDKAVVAALTGEPDACAVQLRAARRQVLLSSHWNPPSDAWLRTIAGCALEAQVGNREAAVQAWTRRQRAG